MQKAASHAALAALMIAAGCVVIRMMNAGPVPRAQLNALISRAGELDTDALVVLKDGKPVVERWFHGAPRPIETMSMTKSVSWMAIARLLTVGKLESLDQAVHTWYPEWSKGPKRRITIRHLLTQTSGIKSDMDTREIYFARDFVRLALDAPLAEAPGEKFFYNNKATNLLAGVVERVAGKRLDDYLKDEIFAPLGIVDFKWDHDRSGNPQAMSGLQLRPADVAKLGQLMLDEGKWRGRELIAGRWVREAIRPSERNARYGQLWWMAIEHETAVGFRAAGWQGQNLIVLPKERLVVVRMREPKEGNTPDEDRKYAFLELMPMARALAGAPGRQQKYNRPLPHSP